MFTFWPMLIFVVQVQGGILTDVVKNTFLDLILKTLPEEQPIRTKNNFELEKEYDFIVVGAGSTGSVLANRLSENRQWKILLLEMGKQEPTYASVPFYAPNLQTTDYVRRLTTEPEEGVCEAMEGQRCAWPRGRVLGGSSVVNYMAYTRGHPEDYDRWAGQNNPGWSYDEVLPYFLKSEDVHLDQYDKKYHHKGGYLGTQTPFQSILSEAFINAGKERCAEKVDYNGRNPFGFSRIQSTLRNGRRASTSSAFLKPIENRPNLHISIQSRVTNVLIHPENKTAYGVRFYNSGTSLEIFARKEVILSAGCLSTPQILMLSGIGPKNHLESLKIPIVQDLPVGEHLWDHLVYLGLTFVINQTIYDESEIYQTSSILEGFLKGTGLLTSTAGIEAVGFIKTAASREVGDYPDIELIFSGMGGLSTGDSVTRRTFRITDEFYDKYYKPLEDKPNWTIFPLLLHPKSSGNLTLRSAEPFDDPILHGNYLQHEDDINSLVAAIKYIIELSQTEAFQRFDSKLSTIPVPGCETEIFNSDPYWRCTLRKLTSSLHHQAGTCPMGPEDDSKAVVDPQLRVYGIRNLRVCDTSVFPITLGGHTNAPTIMLGEKTSDLIKQAWK